MSSVPLLSFEYWLTFLEEGFHAFFAIFGCEQQVEGSPLKLQTHLKRRVLRSHDCLLGCTDGDGRFGGDFASDLLGLIHQTFYRNNFVDEADSKCFFG